LGWSPFLIDNRDDKRNQTLPSRLRHDCRKRITDMSGFPRRVSSSVITKNVSGIALLAALLLPIGAAHAQLMDQLKGAVGSGQGGGATGALGGMPSVGQASPSNTAGVLQYCVKNNYLSGGSAASVKNSLTSKVTGSGNGAGDGGFQAGNNGVLNTGGGQSYSLGGDGIKAQITQKICDQVLQHAKSLL
jgi:hypothetical protein